MLKFPHINRLLRLRVPTCCVEWAGALSRHLNRCFLTTTPVQIRPCLLRGPPMALFSVFLTAHNGVSLRLPWKLNLTVSTKARASINSGNTPTVSTGLSFSPPEAKFYGFKLVPIQLPPLDQFQEAVDAVTPGWKCPPSLLSRTARVHEVIAPEQTELSYALTSFADFQLRLSSHDNPLPELWL